MQTHKELSMFSPGERLCELPSFKQDFPVFVPNEPFIIIDDEPTLLRHYNRLFNIDDGGMHAPHRMQLCALFLTEDYRVITNRFWYINQKNPVGYYVRDVVHTALNVNAKVVSFANYAPSLGSGPDILEDKHYTKEDYEVFKYATGRIAKEFEKVLLPLKINIDSFYLLNARLNFMACYVPKKPKEILFF